ncbi:MAG: ABC transporter ATP-binding protein [Paracoccaceae bacterium]
MQIKTYPAKTLVSWYWRGYVRAVLPWLLGGFGLMAIEGGSLGMLSYMVRPMFDEIFVAGDRGAVFWIAFAVFAIFTARAVTGFLQRVMMANAARKVSAALQRDLVVHLLNLDSGFYQANSPGTLIERVRGDPTAANGVISATFSALGRDVVALVSLLAVAISIDWLWTLIAVAGAPILFLPIVKIQTWVRSTARTARSAAASIATRLDEMFHGINTVKLNSTEDYESARFEKSVRRFVNAELKSVTAQAGIPALMDIVGAVGFLGVLSFAGLQIIEGEKTIGEFMSFFTAMTLIFEPLRRLGSVTGQWQVALASLERLYDVFQTQPEIVTPARPVRLPVNPATANVKFDKVNFFYGDQQILRDTCFVAEAGKTTALVGASGAGKSTVFNILTRLVDAQSGQASIGGIANTLFDLTELRSLFSVVTQDAQLFDETIRNNILLGNSATDAQLAMVLDAAHVSDFLPQLAQSADTPAGPRGSGLSGGQRQRVAIARALLRDTPILLLDEATSALDAKSEAIVQVALEQLSAGRTTLVIAHRLATVREADKIIVMDQGQVVDQGTHQELIKRGGVYRDLYRLQFSEAD